MKRLFALLLTFLMISTLFIVTPAMAVEWDREKFYADSIAQYGALDLSDPQLIPDKKFYGEWNGTEWVQEPMLRYDLYPGLAATEKAAKRGDYKACKEEILAYYQAKHANYNIANETVTNISERERVRAEAYFDNFMVAYKNSVSARILFDETNSWQTANVLSDIKEIAAGVDKIQKFQLVASRKDGYMVEVNTRESEFKPYIRALVDGAYKYFYAENDTYVTGLEPDSSHGSKTTMLVEESVSSNDNHIKFKDEYTKVSFLDFDFTGLTPQNQITEATLYLHGRMKVSDCPAGIRIPSTTKSVYLMPFIRGGTRIDEGLTYTTYRTYDTDYVSWDGLSSPCFQVDTKGLPTNNFVLQYTQYSNTPAVTYNKTGEEIFAWHAIRLMMGMIKENGTYEDMVERDLAGGQTAGNIDGTFYGGQLGYEAPRMMHRIIHSEHMTPDVYSTYLKHMHNLGSFIVNMWCSSDERANWGTYSNKGLCALGMYYPELTAAQAPLVRDAQGNPALMDASWPGSAQGGFIEVSKYRMGYKGFEDFDEDGISVEGSVEYGIEAWYNLLEPIRLGMSLNIDFDDYFSDAMIERLEISAHYLLSHLNPWGGCFQVGDGGTYSMDHASRFKDILSLTDDQVLVYLITKGEKGVKPSYLASIQDKKGWVTLRNAWNKNAMAVNIVGSVDTAGHGHNDDLSLTLAGYGQYLLVDPRMNFYYTDEPNETWLSSTRGHNTVMINDTVGLGTKTYAVVESIGRTKVDGVLQGEDIFGELTYYPSSQAQVEERLVNFFPANRETNTIYDYVRGESFAYKDNNAMESDYQVFRDTLFMHKGYVVVTDYIKPEDMTKENEYEQMWHFLPNANITVDTEADTVRTHFDNKANVIVATVDGYHGVEPSLKKGLYSYTKGENIETFYGNFKQTKAGVTTFNTLIYPMTTTQDVAVYTNPLLLDVDHTVANAFKAELKEKSGLTTDIHYYNLFNEDFKTTRTFGDYTTDGVLALAEKDAQGYGAATLRKGKQLLDKKSNSYLIYSNVDVADLGVEWTETTIKLATEHTEGEGSLDLSQLSIVANNTVTNVQLNGQNIPFKQQGKYVYFGLNPLIADDTENNNNSTNNNNNNNNVGSNQTQNTPTHGGDFSGAGGGGGGGAIIGGGTSLQPNKIFNDIVNHWASDYIEKAAVSGIVKGDEYGNFNPEKSVSRAELLAMAMRALGVEEVPYNRNFTDVEPEDWYSGVVAQALSLGIISPDLWFRPNDPVTREEMCKILVGVAEKLGVNQPEEAETIVFADDDQISQWAKPYVETIVQLGLMNGMEDNTFQGKQTASRAQAVAVIQRALEKISK